MHHRHLGLGARGQAEGRRRPRDGDRHPRAAASDRIEDTLDYKSVAKRLLQFVGDSEFQLVETLAERIAES